MLQILYSTYHLFFTTTHKIDIGIIYFINKNIEGLNLENHDP